MLNHFLVDGEAGSLPNESGTPLAAGCDDMAVATLANAEPFFTTRVTLCAEARGVRPTFVSVDDVDEGDLLGVVQALNRE
jgi:hypothetical protein